MNRLLPRTVLSLSLLASAFAPFAAAAHSPLTGSSPREGAVVSADQVPRQLELKFAHALRLTSLTLVHDGGKKVALKPASKAETTHAVDLPALAPGGYTAQWRGMATDGHVMSGAVRFQVAAR